MIVFGIDPGSRLLGWGAVEGEADRARLLDLGTLRMGLRDSLATRLARLHEGISELLDRVQPDCVGIETVFHGVNTRSLVTLGQARGAVMAAVGARDLELHEFAPAVIKRAVTGRGNATKEQVSRMVWTLLGPAARQRAEADGGLTLDATDALAVALTSLHRQRGPAPAQRTP